MNTKFYNSLCLASKWMLVQKWGNTHFRLLNFRVVLLYTKIKIFFTFPVYVLNPCSCLCLISANSFLFLVIYCRRAPLYSALFYSLLYSALLCPAVLCCAACPWSLLLYSAALHSSALLYSNYSFLLYSFIFLPCCTLLCELYSALLAVFIQPIVTPILA